MCMKTLTQDEAKQVLLNAGEADFDVWFVKKDGSDRHMVACLSTAKKAEPYKRGGKLGYDPGPKGLLPVYVRPGDYEFDVDEPKFRMVNLNTLRRIQIEGIAYEVE